MLVSILRPLLLKFVHEDAPPRFFGARAIGVLDLTNFKSIETVRDPAYAFLLTRRAWPARAALFSCAGRWRARAPPRQRALRDRRRAAPAAANRRARRGRFCPGSWRAYRRRAGCLRARSRDARCVDFQKDRAVELEREHQSFAVDAGAAEHAPDRHRAERREQIANEFGVHAAASRGCREKLQNSVGAFIRRLDRRPMAGSRKVRDLLGVEAFGEM
jgi:hypothetical protein